MGPTVLAMRATAGLRLTPFAPYHWIMYGRSMWFDPAHAAQTLGWRPAYSTNAMFAEAYDWWLARRHADGGGSHHRRPAKAGLLDGVKRVMRLASGPSARRR